MTVLAGLLVANGALLTWHLIAVWRLRRRIRRVEALDTLLAKLCIEAFAARHLPIWQAWTHAYGDISVDIQQTRRMPDAPDLTRGGR